jgi:hypothetical protein
MPWDGIERRRKKRYGIQGCTVEFKRRHPLDFLKNYSRKHLVLNMSELGCCFITKEHFREGNKLRMKITAPGVSGSIIATGRVVWSRKSENIDAYRIGVEFFTMDDNSKKRMKIMLDNAVLESVEVSTRIYLKEIEKL